ncbi:MAG: hypothetical protein MJZ41_07765 [Bacteroidaceae bacterium]|nr:hypothetical protein [Bacteroidaceae bacterium]
MTNEQRAIAIDRRLCGDKIKDIAKDLNLKYQAVASFLISRGIKMVKSSQKKWTAEEDAILMRFATQRCNLKHLQAEYFKDRSRGAISLRLHQKRKQYGITLP